MKPPQAEQIGDVLTRALAAQFNEADKMFLCRNTDGLFRIPKKSIRYFCSDRRQVTCVTDTRRISFYARLDEVCRAGRRVICAHPPALSGARGARSTGWRAAQL